MKKVRSNEEQMVTMLREADRSAIADVARKQRVSGNVSRCRFGKVEPADVKRSGSWKPTNAKLERHRRRARDVLRDAGEIDRPKW
jgi:putative transposase